MNFPTHTNKITTGNFANLNLLKVEENCMTPKYVQVVEILLSDIENGIFKTGQQIPSINESCAEFYLAKETVQKAYNILKLKGVLTSVKGKGYFVSDPDEIKNTPKRCLLLFPDYNEDKRIIFNSFSQSVDPSIETEVYLFHDNINHLEKCLANNRDNFDYFVAHIDCVPSTVTNCLLSAVPKDKLLLIGNTGEGVNADFSIVADDSDKIFQCLHTVIDKISEYKRMKLVFPDSKKFANIIRGLTMTGESVCQRVSLFSSHKEMIIEKGDLIIVKEEADLLNIYGGTGSKLTLGKDVGLIGYTDSTVRQLLPGGISILGPDYESLGIEAGSSLKNQGHKRSLNPFKMTLRNSF